MKKNEVKVGGYYLAKVSGALTAVRVDEIMPNRGGNTGGDGYAVTILRSRRKTTFRSAAKFRKELTKEESKKYDNQVNTKEFPSQQLTPPTETEEQMRSDPLGQVIVSTLTDSPRPTDVPNPWKYICSRCGAEIKIDTNRIPYHKHPTKGITCGAYGEPTLVYAVKKPNVEGEQRTDPLQESGTGSVDSHEEAEHSSDPTRAECHQTSGTTTEGESVPSASNQLNQNQAPMNPMMSVQPAENESITATATSTSIGTRIAATRSVSLEEVAGYKPTEEQAAILAAARQANLTVLVIAAGAGAGKTSTLKMLETILPGRGQYTAFNTSLVSESKAKFQKARCNTTHSLAFGSVGKLYAHRLGGNRVRSEQVAAQLGINGMTISANDPAGTLGEDGKPITWTKSLSAGYLASQVMQAIRKFCQSDDREVDRQHFKYMVGIDNPGERTNQRAVQDVLIPFARKAWEDMTNVNGQLPFTHDAYVKIWGLGVGDQTPVIPADYILLDECFPAGTMIDTDRGYLPIEFIAENPGPWRVLSSRNEGKTLCYTRVTSAYRTPRSGPLVRIEHDSGELVCTANHPLWVIGRGWVAAGLVEEGDTLSCLWEADRAEAKMLLSCVRGTVEGEAQESRYGGYSESQDQQTHARGPHRDTQSNGSPGDQSQGVCDHERTWGHLTGESWRERARTYATRIDVVHGVSETPTELAVEPRLCRLQWTTKKRNTDLLQDRHSFVNEADCDRSGRGIAQESKRQGEGCQEDHNTGGSRVVSVEMCQPRDRGRPRDGSSRDHRFVYTLSVEAGAYYADGVLVKNCQDTAPVFLDIIQRQSALIILVGDSNQSIYQWRGATDAMKAFPGAPRKMLSQSFRFGQAISDVANSILAELDEPTDLVMRGCDIPSRVVLEPWEECNGKRVLTKESRAVLCRTNACAIATVLQAVKQKKRPHLIGGGAETVKFVKAAQDLQSGGGTSHPELCLFKNWREVQAYVKEDEGSDLKLMVKLIDEFKCKPILEALENMPEEEDTDLVVSTAHKSKGREWTSVRLASDFPPRNRMQDSDRRLLYVAATRAQHVLDLSVCPPFLTSMDRETGNEIPPIRIEFTKPMPTAAELEEWLDRKAIDHVSEVEANKLAADPKCYDDQKTGVVDKTQPEFTWANFAGRWRVGGPKGFEGETVDVVRKNGSSSRENLGKMVKEFPERCIYDLA